MRRRTQQAKTRGSQPIQLRLFPLESPEPMSRPDPLSLSWPPTPCVVGGYPTHADEPIAVKPQDTADHDSR
jgi:hypothetical protein